MEYPVGKPDHLRALQRLATHGTEAACPCNRQMLLEEGVVPVEVAEDRNMRRVHPGACLDEFAKLLVSDKMGDEAKFTLQGKPVVHPEILFPAALATAHPVIHH